MSRLKALKQINSVIPFILEQNHNIKNISDKYSKTQKELWYKNLITYISLLSDVFIIALLNPINFYRICYIAYCFYKKEISVDDIIKDESIYNIISNNKKNIYNSIDIIDIFENNIKTELESVDISYPGKKFIKSATRIFLTNKDYRDKIIHIYNNRENIKKYSNKDQLLLLSDILKSDAIKAFVISNLPSIVKIIPKEIIEMIKDLGMITDRSELSIDYNIVLFTEVVELLSKKQTADLIAEAFGYFTRDDLKDQPNIDIIWNFIKLCDNKQIISIVSDNIEAIIDLLPNNLILSLIDNRLISIKDESNRHNDSQIKEQDDRKQRNLQLSLKAKEILKSKKNIDLIKNILDISDAKLNHNYFELFIKLSTTITSTLFQNEEIRNIISEKLKNVANGIQEKQIIPRLNNNKVITAVTLGSNLCGVILTPGEIVYDAIIHTLPIVYNIGDKAKSEIHRIKNKLGGYFSR